MNIVKKKTLRFILTFITRILYILCRICYLICYHIMYLYSITIIIVICGIMIRKYSQFLRLSFPLFLIFISLTPLASAYLTYDFDDCTTWNNNSNFIQIGTYQGTLFNSTNSWDGTCEIYKPASDGKTVSVYATNNGESYYQWDFKTTTYATSVIFEDDDLGTNSTYQHYAQLSNGNHFLIYDGTTSKLDVNLASYGKVQGDWHRVRLTKINSTTIQVNLSDTDDFVFYSSGYITVTDIEINYFRVYCSNCLIGFDNLVLGTDEEAPLVSEIHFNPDLAQTNDTALFVDFYMDCDETYFGSLYTIVRVDEEPYIYYNNLSCGVEYSRSLYHLALYLATITNSTLLEAELHDSIGVLYSDSITFNNNYIPPQNVTIPNSSPPYPTYPPPSTTPPPINDPNAGSNNTINTTNGTYQDWRNYTRGTSQEMVEGTSGIYELINAPLNNTRIAIQQINTSLTFGTFNQSSSILAIICPCIISSIHWKVKAIMSLQLLFVTILIIMRKK